MQISETIGSEAVFFFFSILWGIGLIFVYDIFRIIRRIIKHGTIWIGMEDVCYWLFCTVAVFLLLYQKNDGMMRAFSFIGILIGIVCYHFLLSRFVVKICVFVLGGMLNLIGKILGFTLKPVTKGGKKIWVFLRKQLKKLYKTIRMGLCKL